MHEHNCFVTLTYDDEHLPEYGHLVPSHLQKFLKRVRSAARRGSRGVLGDSFRFLACGEYGDKSLRPHFHAIIFGCTFAEPYAIGKGLFASKYLTDLWRKGHCSFGSVTGASAAYVAQYSLKKTSVSNWLRCDPDGVVYEQPFLRCSLRPGIGATWLERYKNDSRHGYLVRDGEKHAVPRYYQKLLELTDVGLFEEFRVNMLEAGSLARLTDEQRIAGETIELRRLELLNPRKDGM